MFVVRFGSCNKTCWKIKPSTMRSLACSWFGSVHATKHAGKSNQAHRIMVNQRKRVQSLKIHLSFVVVALHEKSSKTCSIMENQATCFIKGSQEAKSPTNGLHLHPSTFGHTPPGRPHAGFHHENTLYVPPRLGLRPPTGRPCTGFPH